MEYALASQIMTSYKPTQMGTSRKGLWRQTATVSNGNEWIWSTDQESLASFSCAEERGREFGNVCISEKCSPKSYLNSIKQQVQQLPNIILVS